MSISHLRTNQERSKICQVSTERAPKLGCAPGVTLHWPLSTRVSISLCGNWSNLSLYDSLNWTMCLITFTWQERDRRKQNPRRRRFKTSKVRLRRFLRRIVFSIRSFCRLCQLSWTFKVVKVIQCLVFSQLTKNCQLWGTVNKQSWYHCLVWVLSSEILKVFLLQTKVDINFG